MGGKYGGKRREEEIKQAAEGPYSAKKTLNTSLEIETGASWK